MLTNALTTIVLPIKMLFFGTFFHQRILEKTVTVSTKIIRSNIRNCFQLIIIRNAS